MKRARVGILTLIMLTAAWLPPAVNAASGDLLQGIHRIQVEILRVNKLFFAYSVSERDPVQERALLLKLRETDALVAHVLSGADSATRPALETVLGDWYRFQATINENLAYIREQGYEETNLTFQGVEQSLSVVDRLDTLSGQLRGPAVTPGARCVAQGREAERLVMRIAMRYTAQDTALGVSSLFSDLQSETDISILAEQFELVFADLENFDTGAEGRAHLDYVVNRWGFIAQSLRNSKQDSVSFLVDRMSDVIAHRIEQVTAICAQQA